MAHEGRLVVPQRGRAVPAEALDDVRGPIRLRVAAADAAAAELAGKDVGE